MKHKLFALLIVLSMLLAACGGAATQAPTDAAKASDSTAAPAVSEPVEITFMAWGSPEELAVWQQVADDFHAANPNITVKMDVSDWESYWTKLDTLFAGGTPPDVFAMDAPLYLDWQSRDVLLNLQPYVDATPGLLDGLYLQTLQAYKVDGKYYGLPRDFQTIVMFYNQDMFDAAGLAYPSADWTWDDVREMAKKLTADKDGDGKSDQYGFSCDLWDMELCWSEAIWSYGGEVISADFTKTLLGEEKARQAWQLFYDMMFTDKSMPDTITAGEYGYDLFQAGMVALWPMGHWAVPGYATSEFKWDVAPMPKGPAGQVTSVNSAGFVVAKASKNADASWKFIQFALGQAGQTRLTELGFAIPVLKSVAESPVFLQAKVGEHNINQQIFLDSVAFARTKPVFKGYTLWADAIGNGMSMIWTGEAELGEALDASIAEADKVLAEEK